MISEQQLVGYFSGTLTSQERTLLEPELSGDRAAQRQLAEQQLIDQALRVALATPLAEERIKSSVLAVVRGSSPEEIRAHVLTDITARERVVPVPLRRGAGTPWRPENRPPFRKPFWTLPAAALQLLFASTLRRYATTFATAVLLIGAGLYFYQSSQLATATEVGKLATVTGSPTLRRLGRGPLVRALPSISIQLGDRIETGDADKAVLQFNDGTSLQLNFNTALEIPKSLFRPFDLSVSQHSNSRPLLRPPTVKLLAGQVLAKVQKLTNAPLFAVQTPVATASVKGTEFRLKLQKASNTPATPNSKSGPKLLAILTVREGTVEFSNTFGKVDATAMTETQATADSAPTQPQRLAALKTFRLNSTHLTVMNPKLVLQDAPEYLVYPVGWIGVSLVNAAAGGAPAASPSPLVPTAVRVSGVRPGSPAALAGLQVDDLVSAVNGQTVTNTRQVRAATLVSLNRPLTLSLQRAGGQLTATVIPAQPPNSPPLPAIPLQVQNGLFEATAQLIASGFQRQIAPGQVTESETALQELLRRYPDAAALHHNLAFVYESKDELGQAIRHYQRAIELDPFAALYRLNLGLALRSIGNVERSLEELEEAARRAPAWPLASYWLADAYSVIERHDEAIKAVEAGLRLNPNDPTLWQQKAEVLLRASQAQAALPVALKAVELDPASAPAHITLGNIYDDLNRKDEAEAEQRKAVELGPSSDTAYYNLANLLKKRGQLDEAEALYRKAIERQPDDADAWRGVGQVFFARRQAREAEKWYRKAFELNPNDPLICGSLGNILRELGQLDQGEQLLRRAIELDPENAEAHANLGILYYQRRQWTEAEQLLLKASELDTNLPVERQLRLVYQAQGRLEEEEQAIRGWLARNTNDVAACNELAWHLAERAIKLDEALTLAIRAVDLAPTNAGVLDTLGWVYYQRGELDQAETWLKKAVDLAGDGPASASMREHLKKAQEKKANSK